MNVHFSPDVVHRELEGEAVLLDLSTGTYFGLNEVGTRIWSSLAEEGDTDRVVRALMDEYEVSEEQLRRDVEALVVQLAEKGLVKIDG